MQMKVIFSTLLILFSSNAFSQVDNNNPLQTYRACLEDALKVEDQKSIDGNQPMTSEALTLKLIRDKVRMCNTSLDIEVYYSVINALSGIEKNP